MYTSSLSCASHERHQENCMIVKPLFIELQCLISQAKHQLTKVTKDKPQRERLCFQGLHSHNTFLRCLHPQTKTVHVEWKVAVVEGAAVWRVRGVSVQASEEVKNRREDRGSTSSGHGKVKGGGELPRLIKGCVTDHTPRLQS